jgi:hypothetical protein
MRQFFLTFSSTEIFQSLIEKSTGETSGGRLVGPPSATGSGTDNP